jgi:hypothetical protein
VDGIRRLCGEVALEREVALLRGEIVGERADAGRADAEAEGRRGDGEERRSREREAERRTPQYAVDDRAPEPAFRVCPLDRAPADERQPDGVDAVVEQPEQSG